jgi:hypothetical protein
MGKDESRGVIRNHDVIGRGREEAGLGRREKDGRRGENASWRYPPDPV